MRAARFLLTAALLVPQVGLPARAQAAATNGGGVYPADFFTHAQPITAFDMIGLLPGFRLIEGDADLRGYSGAAGNVLVDGQRPAGKAETLEGVLKRIPAARVARIELLRAGAAGIDMQGYPLLANVILHSNDRLGGRVEAQHAVYRRDLSAPRLAAQIDFERADHELNVSGAIYREIDDKHGFGTRNRFAIDGTSLRLAAYAQPEFERVKEASATYRRPLLGGELRLDGLLRNKLEAADIGYDILMPTPEVIIGSERKHVRTREAGLRFERPLGAASSFDLVASFRTQREAGVDSETSPSGSDVSEENGLARETILRGAFRHQRGLLTLELGAEGAINSLDSRNLLFEDGVNVLLPNADVRVEEHRAEFFASSNWKLGARLTLEAGLRYEISRLTQSGDMRLAKSLAFAKPRARLNWSPGANSDLRWLVEREVGQLDFGHFVGAASLNAGTISAGNRDLEPDSLWRAELSLERRFGSGSLVLAARREWISDLVDQLPVMVGGAIYDAVGNIGNARRDEVEAALKLPMDGLGLKGVQLIADATARRSRTTDPSTGERRRISKDIPVEAKISLTHDIPGWRLRWGGSIAFGEEERSFKIREVQTDRRGERVELFAEYKPDERWAIRLFGRNLTDSAATRTREIYSGIRGSAPLRHIDARTLRSGPYFGLQLQRRFGG